MSGSENETEPENSTFEELKNEQEALYEQIQQFVSNFKRSPKVRLQSVGHIKGRIVILDKLWEEFTSNDKAIRSSATSQEKQDKYFDDQGGLYDKFMNIVFEYKGILNDILTQLCEVRTPASQNTSNPNDQISSAGAGTNKNTANPPIVNQSTQSTHDELKLPRISIPTFSGDYGSWLSFYDIFNSMIHSSESIPPVQKMHYLKSCLKGEAEQIVRHLNVTNDNYQIAWDILCKRYHNSRVLVNNALKILFSQAHIHTESAPLIRKLLDSTNESIATLKNLDVKVEEWDPLVIYILVERLPSETRQLWEQNQGATTSLPKLSDIQEFLEARYRTLEALQSTKPRGPRPNFRVPEGKARSFHITRHVCPVCKGSHSVKLCQRFARMSPRERSQFVSSHSMCFNCLAQSHLVSSCPSKMSCRHCHKRHNSLLHNSDISRSRPQAQDTNSSLTGALSHSSNANLSEQPPSTSESANQSPSSNILSSYFSRGTKEVLLATVLVRALSKTGELHTLRALVDPGSEATFVTNRTVQLLRLNPLRASVQVTGLGNTLTGVSHSSVHLEIQPYVGDRPKIIIKAVVLHSLTECLPPRKILSSQWNLINTLPLADPSFDKPGKIDMILGAEVYAKIIQNGLVPGESGCPTAQNTSFGWILFGEINTPELESPSNNRSHKPIVVNFCNQVSDCEILRQFWELEEVSVPCQTSPEDALCEQIFADTHSRTKEGRYVVHLPFAPMDPNESRLGESRSISLKRYHSLERRLAANPSLKRDYNACLEEYLEDGHMEKVNDKGPLPEGNVCYFPHHAVLKAESLTTKTRVVFDASCKTANGYSLNDRLLSGPPLQRDISLLLFEWRQKRYVFTADIARMYRQILIHPSERDYQRILWRRLSNDPVEDYRLLTVTFGVSSAPFLAIRTLHQLAKDERHEFPIGAATLVRDLYVDDVLSGGRTLDEAKEVKSQIDAILKRGKFELRKWSSNCPELLDDKPKSDIASADPVLLNKENVIKTLGLYWAPGQDCFAYKVQVQAAQPPFTKRTILSQIARIYDPLGLLALVVVSLKLMLQKLWQEAVGWDEPVPRNISEQWLAHISLLGHLNHVTIPRYVKTEPHSIVQLHGFCDASERAYGAVLYLRSETNGKINVRLVSAKTKVAPLKPVTLPRLELCGAVLLSKLIKKFQPSLLEDNACIFAWTDSTIVLSWLRRHPNDFKTFVRNRVSEIITNLGSIPWRHVPSAANPADLASRGITAVIDLKNPLWWYGPAWLSRPEEHWPSRFNELPPQQDHFELRATKALMNTQSSSYSVQMLNRFSSLTRLLRVTALCKTFSKRCRMKDLPSSSWISTKDLQLAREFWIRHEQGMYFHEELHLLRNKNPLKRSSALVALNPFIDSSGVLRVGGRLEHTFLPYNERHPVILPPSSHLTYLLVQNAHSLCLHGGPTLTLSVLRKTVWIVNGRKVVKKFIRQCIPCFRSSCETQTQLMGSLPSPRVNAARPFTNAGVDYAGPFNLSIARTRGARTYKGYICIFVCLYSKAVHIEVVSDLTTNAFMAALKRFIARRGFCGNIFSDCGTTFVGARNQIDHDLKKAYFDSTHHAANSLLTQGIQWHFIPPSSPHFGGLWEAGVKSIKTHLKRIVAKASLTFEEMYTLMTQIESCLNSRPLCPMSDDINDLGALTPGHLLIGESLLAPPEQDVASCKLNVLDRWKFIQRLKQDFWNAWRREYFSRLQARPKWVKATENIKIGDLILLKSENLPSNQWGLGRVTQVHPGVDGLVRVVTIKTKAGEIKRPITKVCLLPVNSQ